MKRLYENIKAKRIDIGMSQSELAKLTGYASKSMISKIENGQIDLPDSKISVFAKALNTTEMYLRYHGMENEEDWNSTKEIPDEYYENMPDDPDLLDMDEEPTEPDETRILIEAYYNADKYDRRAVRKILGIYDGKD